MVEWKLFLFFLLVGLASSFAIANDEFVPRGSTGRNLLQQKASCPVNFENQNYTIITSQCKGPNYGKICCTAFKQFACPFRDQINDQKSDCATTMFSYINLYGKYPPGLFANICIEGKEGLDCSGVEQKKEEKNDAPKSTQSTMLMIAAGSLMLLWNML